ncbi:TPM domain-containing protein [Brevundimonas guildfordensis]|uniref:YgcG family protein n=1 Tax=Brevundimonas guildfordensis TaxID=2762241 RepID=A0ABR8QYD2_9CAUL|nr:YgcG family protein [Brevundimonas guildfordensis]MBD7940528.1 YgcG family protein [Brevundimonas guildfordensis]
MTSSVLARWADVARGLLAAVMLVLVVWLAALPGASLAAEIKFPTLTGRVVDDAQLLTPQQEQALTGKLEALEQQTGDQLVVVTLPSLQDQEIEDFGYQLGRHWGIGQKENDGGALLIVAPNERKVRIEVGYGLEGVLTDAYSSLIIRNDILPPFREGDYATGIIAGTDAIITQLTADPAEAQARAEEAKSAATATAKPVIPAVVILMVFAFIFFSMIGAAAGGRKRRGGRGDGLTPILIWAASEALKDRDRGGRGGWGGGGGFGGGGFGGGGGGFGGGGASGGW